MPDTDLTKNTETNTAVPTPDRKSLAASRILRAVERSRTGETTARLQIPAPESLTPPSADKPPIHIPSPKASSPLTAQPVDARAALRSLSEQSSFEVPEPAVRPEPVAAEAAAAKPNLTIVPPVVAEAAPASSAPASSAPASSANAAAVEVPPVVEAAPPAAPQTPATEPHSPTPISAKSPRIPQKGSENVAQAKAEAPAAEPAAAPAAPAEKESKGSKSGKRRAMKAAQAQAIAQANAQAKAQAGSAQPAAAKSAGAEAKAAEAPSAAPVEAKARKAPAFEAPTLGMGPNPSQSFWANLPMVVKAGALVLLLGVGGGLAFKFSGEKAKASVTQTARPAPKFVPMSGMGGWTPNWGDPAKMDGRSISLFRPSLQHSDYRIEFDAQIESKSFGWVFRAKDPQNYYGYKVETVKPGLQALVALARVAVVAGVESQKHYTLLENPVRPDTVFHVTMDAQGSEFTTRINGQLVEVWQDDRLRFGGVGLFSDRGERAQVRKVQIFEMR